MTSSTLYLLGTPNGIWPASISAALLGIPGVGTTSPGTKAGRLCTDASSIEGALTAAPSDSQWLVFVEHPAEGLASALASDRPPEPEQWLLDWERGSRPLLRLVQSQRSRCLFVDAAEAESAPDALRERLVGWAGGAVSLPNAPGNLRGEPVDPLCRTVAMALVGGRVSAVKTYRELHACCEWLVQRAAGPAPLPPQAPIDSSEQVVQRLVALRRQASELPVATAALERSTERVASLKSDLEAARAESDVLLQRLHEAQEAHEQAELRLNALRAERAAPPPPIAAAQDSEWVHIDELLATSVRDERPYREIAYTLRGIRIGARRLAAASVRLVEHHGHPGLALFAPKGQASGLLEAWQPNGQEDGQAFMLIVPSDDQGLALTQALGGADWMTLLAVAARIEAALCAAAPGQQRTWLPLARRLREQFDGLPPRFRWSDVQATSVAGAAPFALDLTLRQVSWGARRLAHLGLRWQPDGAGEGIALSRSPQGDEPLLSWPDDAHGDAPDRLWLVASVADTDRSTASNLRSQDLAFVRALLEAWPRIASALPADTPGLPPADADRLRLAQFGANRILQQLSRADAGRQGSLIRRVGRRLLRSTRPAV